MRVVGAVAGVVASAGIAAGALAVAQPPRHGQTHPIATYTWTKQVGPGGSPTGTASRRPAAAGGASEVISGVTQSTSAVRFTSSGQPVYYGTEPATMAVERRGRQLAVTVTLR